MTNLTEVYESFLQKITDYTFLSLMESELNEELFGYFKSARAKFKKCKQSLSTTEDVEGNLHFDVVLTDFEIEILATLMLVEYIKPQVISSESMKQVLGDKDFKIYSQASQLRELRELLKSTRAEANKMITEYTFFDLDKEKM